MAPSPTNDLLVKLKESYRVQRIRSMLLNGVLFTTSKLLITEKASKSTLDNDMKALVKIGFAKFVMTGREKLYSLA